MPAVLTLPSFLRCLPSPRHVVAAWVLAAGGVVQAEPVPAPVAREVRAVVQSQLDAFAADDAPKAFALAAPGIREMFGSPDRFLAMVRAQYPMVHRPASVVFMKPHAEGTGVVQPVQMLDADGARWLASYMMQRGKDGRWRIGACVVKPATQRITT